MPILVQHGPPIMGPLLLGAGTFWGQRNEEANAVQAAEAGLKYQRAQNQANQIAGGLGAAAAIPLQGYVGIKMDELRSQRAMDRELAAIRARGDITSTQAAEEEDRIRQRYFLEHTGMTQDELEQSGYAAMSNMEAGQLDQISREMGYGGADNWDEKQGQLVARRIGLRSAAQDQINQQMTRAQAARAAQQVESNVSQAFQLDQTGHYAPPPRYQQEYDQLIGEQNALDQWVTSGEGDEKDRAYAYDNINQRKAALFRRAHAFAPPQQPYQPPTDPNTLRQQGFVIDQPDPSNPQGPAIGFWSSEKDAKGNQKYHWNPAPKHEPDPTALMTRIGSDVVDGPPMPGQTGIIGDQLIYIDPKGKETIIQKAPDYAKIAADATSAAMKSEIDPVKAQEIGAAAAKAARQAHLESLRAPIEAQNQKKMAAIQAQIAEQQQQQAMQAASTVLKIQQQYGDDPRKMPPDAANAYILGRAAIGHPVYTDADYNRANQDLDALRKKHGGLPNKNWSASDLQKWQEARFIRSGGQEAIPQTVRPPPGGSIPQFPKDASQAKDGETYQFYIPRKNQWVTGKWDAKKKTAIVE